MYIIIMEKEKENVYNIHFCVKYKSIQEELLKNHEENIGYAIEDIYDVCSKLYRDEYASVFYCNHILDDKIDENLRKLYDLFSLNQPLQDCISKMLESMGEDEENKEPQKYFCFLSLFSEDLFYLTHTLICDFLKTNTINKELLEEIFQEWQKE
jgi:hypothetical protein